MRLKMKSDKRALSKSGKEKKNSLQIDRAPWNLICAPRDLSVYPGEPPDLFRRYPGEVRLCTPQSRRDGPMPSPGQRPGDASRAKTVQPQRGGPAKRMRV